MGCTFPTKMHSTRRENQSQGVYSKADPQVQLEEKLWHKFGALAYWCPVLKRFISEGERLRLEHWFHNGDGSAQQRYFYNQNEMLDMHGGFQTVYLLTMARMTRTSGPATKKKNQLNHLWYTSNVVLYLLIRDPKVTQIWPT